MPIFLFVFVSYAWYFSVIILLVPLFSFKTLLQWLLNPSPRYIGMLYPPLFFVLGLLLCLLILSNVDRMHFVTFLCLHVKRFHSKIHLCLQQDWLSGWPLWSFANPSLWFKYCMLEHISLLNLKFLMLVYFHQYAVDFCSLMLFFSSCCICSIWWFELQKCKNKPLPFLFCAHVSVWGWPFHNL